MANYPKCPRCGATGWIGSDQPPCACVIEDERLTTPPQPDQFEHESPLRAFTDWNEAGDYAIGKGLRPSAQHLPVYLDAIERKEGWQLMQMLLDDHGAFRSAIFRRAEPVPTPAMDFPNVTSREQAERVATFDAPWLSGFAESMRKAISVPNKFHSTESELSEAYSLPLDYPRCGVTQSRPVETGRVADDLMSGIADDPINPRYYGGTACAEIGERLTGNCYMVLKYIWRLGEKDDPLIELGKAIWYAEREMMLGLPRSHGHVSLPGMKHNFVLARTKDSPWRREIACMLWKLCYGCDAPLRWADTMHDLLSRLEAKKAEMTPVMNDRGRGMEP